MKGKKIKLLGVPVWLSQSVGWLTSAQVMISPLVSSSPASGSVPTAQSLEPALDSVSVSVSVSLSLSLSAPRLCSCSVSLPLKNKH